MLNKWAGLDKDHKKEEWHLQIRGEKFDLAIWQLGLDLMFQGIKCLLYIIFANKKHLSYVLVKCVIAEVFKSRLWFATYEYETIKNIGT